MTPATGGGVVAFMRFHRPILLLTAMLAGFTAPAVETAVAARLTCLSSADFQAGTNDSGGLLLVSHRIPVATRWDLLVVSWSAATNVSLAVEARGWRGEHATRWYPLGEWSAHGRRTSPGEILDDDGVVETDLLALTQPADAAEVRLAVTGPRDGLKLVGLSFRNSQVTTPSRPPHRAAWGMLLDVPVRSQAEFPEGVDKWCSPTSTSMLLGFWARKLGRPELDFTVPATAAAVFDPGWGGTGNWPFNTAFAGAQPGMLACVSRFNDLTDLEQWLAAGLPAAVSVSYALLKGQPEAVEGDGHLVVVRGFTATGEVAVNDPGVRRDRGQKVVPRADFDRAWAHSGRTCYLVWPESRAIPAGGCFPAVIPPPASPAPVSSP